MNEMARAPLVPPRTWLSSNDAARVLGITPNNFGQARSRGDLTEAIDWKPSPERPSAFLYARDDLQRLRSIMDRVEVGIEIACRILIALEKDGPL